MRQCYQKIETCKCFFRILLKTMAANSVYFCLSCYFKWKKEIQNVWLCIIIKPTKLHIFFRVLWKWEKKNQYSSWNGISFNMYTHLLCYYQSIRSSYINIRNVTFNKSSIKSNFRKSFVLFFLRAHTYIVSVYGHWLWKKKLIHLVIYQYFFI